jgi:hypothetical protein
VGLPFFRLATLPVSYATARGASSSPCPCSSPDDREADLSWVYWLFAGAFALALYRALHARHQLQRTGRSRGPLTPLNVYGPVILVVALFAGYLIAGSAMRVVLVVMLLIGAVDPSVVSFAEGYSGEKKARNLRRWLLIVLAALAALVVLSFFLKLLILLPVAAGVVAIVVLSALLLGVFRR